MKFQGKKVTGFMTYFRLAVLVKDAKGVTEFIDIDLPTAKRLGCRE